MVVVTSLGPPEEGVRHTQANVATFVNRCGKEQEEEEEGEMGRRCRSRWRRSTMSRMKSKRRRIRSGRS